MTAASFWLLRHYVGGGNPSIVCEEERSATERASGELRSFDAATNGGVRERDRERRSQMAASDSGSSLQSPSNILSTSC